MRHQTERRHGDSAQYIYVHTQEPAEAEAASSGTMRDRGSIRKHRPCYRYGNYLTYYGYRVRHAGDTRVVSYTCRDLIWRHKQLSHT